MKSTPIFKVFVSVALALLLAQIYLLSTYYISNYSNTDGFRLANDQPVGGDFVTFYQAGEVIKNEPENLYNFEYYLEKQREFFKKHNIQMGKLVFAYPPLVGNFFGSLPRGTLLQAYLTWTAISLLLFFVSIAVVMRSVNASWRAVAIACFASVGFYCFSLYCIANGQTSTIGTAIFAAIFLLFRKAKYFLAGLVLSLSYYKPPLFLGFVLVMLFSRNWKVIAGFLCGGITLIFTTVITYGYQNFIYYISRTSSYRYGQELAGSTTLKIEKGVGLLAAIEGLQLLPSSVAQIIVLILTSIIAFYLGNFQFRTIGTTRKSLNDSENLLMLFTCAISFSLLFSFQMVVYDLSILFPFAAASTYIIIKRSNYNYLVSIFFVAIVAMYYEFAIRSIPFGNLLLQGTAFVWIIWTAVLFKLRTSGNHK